MNIIKSVIKSISKPLVYICNLSLSSGNFPDGMKIARVIPLYKEGEKDCSQIIGLFHYFLSFQKYLKRFIIADQINLFPNMTFYQIVSMVLGKLCQLILLLIRISRRINFINRQEKLNHRCIH